MELANRLLLLLLVLGSLSIVDGRLQASRHRKGMNMNMRLNRKFDALFASVELIPAEEEEEKEETILGEPLRIHVRALQEVEGLGSDPAEFLPLQMCQGDCDEDLDVRKS
jgi:hypothetical protein